MELEEFCENSNLFNVRKENGVPAKLEIIQFNLVKDRILSWTCIQWNSTIYSADFLCDVFFYANKRLLIHVPECFTKYMD